MTYEIHAHELAIIAGLSPFCTPLELYARKRGLLPEPEDRHLWRRGRSLQAVLLKWYSEDHKVMVAANDEEWQSGKYEWLVGTPDGFALNARCERSRVIEAKTARSKLGWGEPGTGEVPESYAIQAQAYMEICDLPTCDFVVDFGSDPDEPGYYTVKRDPALMALLIQQAEAFLRCLETETPPAPVGAESEAQALAAIFPARPALAILANTGAIEENVWRLFEAKAKREAAETEEQRIESEIKLRIQDHDGVEGPYGRLTWKRTADAKSTDWKALALSLNPSAEQIQQCMTVRPGVRRFCIPNNWRDYGRAIESTD